MEQLTLFKTPDSPVERFRKVNGGIYLDKGVKPSEAQEWLLGIGEAVYVVYDGIRHIKEICEIGISLSKLDHYPDYVLKASKIKKEWSIVSSGHKTKSQEGYCLAKGSFENPFFESIVQFQKQLF